ncbi:hypothetical protein ACED51_23130, partial [Photobacterium swingsii]|uniref:hypothetical protein n=2 Tax=Photobacterium swingsii TaxID=680026 RepID=UPI00352D6FEA
YSFHECPHRLHGQIVKEQFLICFRSEEVRHSKETNQSVKHFFKLSFEAFTTLTRCSLNLFGKLLSVSVRRHYRDLLSPDKHKLKKNDQADR